MSTWIFWGITGLLAPIVLAVIRWWVVSMQTRIDHLEKTTMSEERARSLIQDKLDPVKEDIKEIKDYLRQLLEIYIQQKKYK